MKLTTFAPEFAEALPILEQIEAAGFEAYFVGGVSVIIYWAYQFMMLILRHLPIQLKSNKFLNGLSILGFNMARS